MEKNLVNSSFHDLISMMKRVGPAPTWRVVSDDLTGPAGGVREVNSSSSDEGFVLRVSTIFGKMLLVCGL